MAVQNKLGYKTQVAKYDKALKFLASWPFSSEGLAEVEEDLQCSGHTNLIYLIKGLEPGIKIMAGKYIYMLLEQPESCRFFYRPWAETDYKVRHTVDHQDPKDIMRMSLLFHNLRHEQALIRVATIDSQIIGKPWGAIGRVGLDRVTLEFCSENWPQNMEIRYSHMKGTIVQWGHVDIDPDQYWGWEEYYDENGKFTTYHPHF